MRRAARLVRPRPRPLSRDHPAFVGQTHAVLGGDDVAVSNQALARSHIREAVYNDEAVEAHADTAEDAARPPAAPCRAPGRLAQLVEYRGDGLAAPGSARAPVHGDVHATRPRPGRSTRNGAGSRWGGVPVNSSATRRPVAGPGPIPAPSSPVACQTPGARGSGPMTGRWSGR